MRWLKDLLDDPGMQLFFICFVLMMLGIASATGDLDKIIKWFTG